MTVTFRHLRVIAGAIVAMVTVAALPACSDANQRFCDSLSSNWRLDELRDAIERGDDTATQQALQRFAELADLAPAEIADDMRALVDTLTDSVRIVTQSKGPDGLDTPVDPQDLSAALGSVADNSQHVEEFADRECGIHLG